MGIAFARPDGVASETMTMSPATSARTFMTAKAATKSSGLAGASSSASSGAMFKVNPIVCFRVSRDGAA